MKTPAVRSWRTIACLGLSALMQVSAIPAPDNTKGTWAVKTYRLKPGEFLINVEPTSAPSPDPGKTVDLDFHLPAETAPEKKHIEFIKRSTDAVKKALELQGLDVPESTLFAYDAKTWTLAARTNPDCHRRLSATEAFHTGSRPSFLNFRLEVLEADAAVIRSIVQAAATKSDHASLLLNLEKRANEGTAKRVTTLSGDTSNGRRCHLTNGALHSEITDVVWDQNFNPIFTESPIQLGMDVELDASQSDNRKNIDFYGTLSYDFAPPKKEWAELPINTPRPLMVPLVHHRKTSTSISSSMKTGGAKLLSVWSTEEVGVAPKTLQAAFLRGNIVPVRPAENLRMGKMLRELGDAISPVPPDQRIAEGFIMRTYKLPDLCFGKHSTELAKEALEHLGAKFPTGSTVDYIEETKELRVRNTLRNLKHIGNLLTQPRLDVKRDLTATVQIVQADAAILRKLERTVAGSSDHTAAWEKLQSHLDRGHGQFLSTLQFPFKLDGRTKSSTGEEHANVALEFEEPAPNSSNTNEDAETQDPKPNKDVAHPPPQSRKLRGTFTSELVGTALEIDPVFDESQTFLDITVSLQFDYAPPTQTSGKTNPPRQKQLIMEPTQPMFHRFMLNSTLTMQPGQWRLIGLWTPDHAKGIMQAAFMRVDAPQE